MKMYLPKLFQEKVIGNFKLKNKLSKPFRIATAMLLLFVTGMTAKAQFTATWVLTSNASSVVTGADLARVTAGDMIPGTNFAPGSYSTSGFRCKLTTTWPNTATDGDNLDFPLSPNAGFDLTITSISVSGKVGGSSGNNILSLAYQVDGTGPWTPFGSTVTANSGGSFTGLVFTGLNQTFFNGHTYAVRMYAYSSTTGTSNSRNLDINNFIINGTTAVSGTPPSVTTDAVGSITNSAAIVTGTITQGTIPVLSSGVAWSTTSGGETVPSSNSTTDGPTSGTAIAGGAGGNITGLAASTTYYVKAYVTTLAGTTYGNELQFTSGAAVAPTVTTTPTTNITSFGTATGGDVTDDGGSPVTARGVVWSTTSGAEALPSPNSTSDGTGAGIFTSQITGLAASTTYYVKAYATNSLGTSYGNEVSFTTTAPQPSLFANVPSLNFPATAVGASTTLTYTLTGSTLDGSPVTISAPAGFTVSPTTVAYTGTSFTQTVTVTFTPTQLGSFSGSITQSGGGATGVYILSPSVSGNGKQPTPAVTSSQGNDFWLGFGYQKDMNASSQKVFMSIYVSALQSTDIRVEMPALPGFNGGLGYYDVTVPANQVVTIPDYLFPKNTFLDSTGITGKGVHIYSKDGKLISAWLHTYSYDNSAGGSLLFPTNTWNSSYYVQSSGGKVNNGYTGNSYFFVVAQDDNTVVKFIPSNPIIKPTSAFTQNHTAADILYPAGVEDSVVLNRGEVFNAVGYIDGSTDYSKAGAGALDLTGTKVYTTCDKKIAVFGGDGRLGMTVVPGCVPNKPTSDHLIQQMLPSSAWGKEYITVPTKTMEFNMFRISVQDPATVVTVNGQVLDPSTLISNLYYSIANDSINLIKADKPISVAQYILDNACSYLTTNNGIDADPEMIIISPVEQGIKQVTVYSAPFKSTASESSTGGSFINVVLKKDGLASFTIDGISYPDGIVDTGWASSGPYPNVTDSSSFCTLAQAFHASPDTGYVWAQFRVQTAAQHTLSSNAEFNAIAYGTRGGNAGESYGYNAGTLVKDLTSPLLLQNPYGGPVSSANSLNTCLGTDFKIYATLPYQTNKISFGYAGNPHISPNTDTTLNGPGGANITPDSSIVVNGQTFYVYKLNRTHQFDTTGAFSITVTSFDPTNEGGCLGGGDKTISYTINVANGVTADFSTTYNSCKSDTVQLTDQSVGSNGFNYNVISWKWTYNNGATPLPSPLDTVQNPKFKNPSDNAANNFTLRAVNSIGCYNDKTKVLVPTQTPVATLSAFEDICQNASSFALTGGSPTGGIYFGRGVSNGSFDPAVAGAGLDTIYYSISTGCGDTASATIRVNPSTALSITPVSPLCITADAVTLVPNVAGGTFSGAGVTGSSFNPAQAGVGSHQITYSAGGCAQDASINIVVGDVPTVDASANPSTISARGAAVTLTGTSSVTGTYAWTPSINITDASALTTTAHPTQSTTYTFTVTTDANCVASDTVSVNLNLCVHVNKAFTPNGDGQNDVWYIYYGDCVQKAVVNVYNRWGGLVFHSDDYHNDWNGNYKNNRLADGTYYYVIKITSDNVTTTYTGNVTIIR